MRESDSASRRTFVLQIASSCAALLPSTGRAQTVAMVDGREPHAVALGYVADAGRVGTKKHPKSTAAVESASVNTMVRMFTTLGPIDVSLDSSAPRSVENFLAYLQSKAYDGTFFHRAPRDSVVGGGGYVVSGSQLPRIPTRRPIVLEFSNDRPNARGTISMARTAAPDSATSEWFINMVDNTTNLGASNGGGYAVFGRVTSPGMVVADAIAALPLANLGGAFDNLPVLQLNALGTQAQDLVYITSAVVLPTPTSNADLAFDYLEATYWRFLKPPGSVSATGVAGGVTYYFRFYPASNSYIGVSVPGNEVFYLVPGVSPNITRLSTLADLMPAVAAAGYVSRVQPQNLVDEKDPLAVALGYVADAKRVDVKRYPRFGAGQNCNSCALFQGKPADITGGCPLFSGKQVAGAGWCSAWAKKA